MVAAFDGAGYNHTHWLTTLKSMGKAELQDFTVIKCL
jgi:hypothetical protein